MTALMHNLPAEPNRFVGRARDLNEAHRLAEQSRILTMCGLGGIGKTRFALRIAARLVEDYPDGVWLVELARLSRPELIAHEVAAILGVQEEAGRTPMAGLIDFLRSRRVLLLLDNCEHLVDACADLADALLAACPEVQIFATSREPLKVPGELVWRVPPLELPQPGDSVEGAEAVQLFMERATAAGSGLRLTDDNAESIAGLCRALDGVPLALELAAARTAVLSPEQIAQRIGDRFQLLTAHDRTAPARQRTLTATLQWSYDLLTESERVLLSRLAVFAGSFDLDLAERVCADADLPQEEILDLLGSLVDKSLVISEHRGDRASYQMLETTRQFAAGLLLQGGELDRLRDRHLTVLGEIAAGSYRVLLAVPRTPWPRRLAAFLRLAAMQDDVRGALGWAIEAGRPEAGLRLACPCYPLWGVRGLLAEGRSWYERLLALDTTTVPPEILGAAWIRHGSLALNQADLVTAGQSEHRGLEMLRTGEPGFELCWSLVLVAAFHLYTGDTDRADEFGREALEMARACGDLWNEGSAEVVLAKLAAKAGNSREAQRRGERGLKLLREDDQHWAVAMALITLGELAESRGDLDAAAAYLEESVTMLAEMDAKSQLSLCLAALGKVTARLGDIDLGRRRMVSGLELSRATGFQLGAVQGLAALATLAETQDDLPGAVRLLAAAAALEEATGLQWSPPRAEPVLARARERLGDPQVKLLWDLGRSTTLDEAMTYGTQHQSWTPATAVADSPPSGPSGLLTLRERQIAALLAQGLSNKAIAQELVISPATSARHVANILLKLGFTSRTQVAAWAIENKIT